MSSSSNGKEKSMHGNNRDVEKGDPERRFSVIDQDWDELDEYRALQKYIAAYRDPRAVGTDDEEGQQKDAADAKKGGPWWAFWRRGTSKQAKPQDPGVVPEDWLDTNIKRGVSAQDVENRRRQFGFNELTTEKENMFLKFLSYFTGPILYSQYSHDTVVTPGDLC
jgi:H+-transporting ATPase